MRLKSALVLGSLILATGLQAAAFEGKILYGISTPKGKSQKMAMTLSGSKVRSDISSMGHLGAAIIDKEARTMTLLMVERKAYMVQKMADPSKASQPQGKLSKSGATGTVAGYPVTEWVYETDKGKTSLWLTDKLGKGFFDEGKAAPQFDIPAELKNKDLLALRISNDKGFKMEAESVKPGHVDPALFTVPSDYTQMTLPAGLGAGAAEGAGAAAKGSVSPDTAARIQQAMQNMTPEQKAAIEKAMQGQGMPQQP